jgi:hypothetical protein
MSYKTAGLAGLFLLLVAACSPSEGPDRSDPPPSVPASTVVASTPVPSAPRARLDAGGATAAPTPTSGAVTGGGPDDPAVQRIGAQLPSLGSAYATGEGKEILPVIKKLASLTPLAGVVETFGTIADCATQQGVMKYRGYGLMASYTPRRYSAFGFVIIFSQKQATNVGFASCIFVNGGPGVQLCGMILKYSSLALNVIDTYYAVLLGTHRRVCNDLAGWYGRFSPQILQRVGI